MGFSAIYLSPHIGDAVYSCGGQLTQRVQNGEKVLVVTMVTDIPTPGRHPLARKHHADRSSCSDAASWIQEDRQACSHLGVAYRHASFLEALYRKDPDTGAVLYPSRKALFSEPHSVEQEETWRQWSAWLDRLPQADIVFAPLGVGLHVDHLLTRWAAEDCFRNKLWYYEEFPYAERWGAVWKMIRPPQAWKSNVIPLTEEEVRMRCSAGACYRSQWGGLFKNQADLEARIRRYVRRRGGEQVWQYTPHAKQMRESTVETWSTTGVQACT